MGANMLTNETIADWKPKVESTVILGRNLTELTREELLVLCAMAYHNNKAIKNET
jgi:hypothetical protein